MTDWSGRDYAEVSGLQCTMITAARAALAFSQDDWVLDIGCGDNFLTLDIADLVPDAAVSFNAPHWVPQQAQALGQIASVLKPGGRATLQMVYAGPRESLESVAMNVCESPPWSTRFENFDAPLHPDPDGHGELAASVGLTPTDVMVMDREWDFGSRDAFQRWCGVGSTAWTDRLPASERDRFADEEVSAYEPVAGRPGVFGFTQMRAELRR